MVGNGCHSLPRRRSARLERGADLSLGLAHANRRQHLGQRFLRQRSAAARIAATSSGDLTARSRSTSSFVGTTLARVNAPIRSASRTVSACASMPSVPPGQPPSTRPSRSQTLFWSTSTSAAPAASDGACMA